LDIGCVADTARPSSGQINDLDQVNAVPS